MSKTDLENVKNKLIKFSDGTYLQVFESQLRCGMGKKKKINTQISTLFRNTVSHSTLITFLLHIDSKERSNLSHIMTRTVGQLELK